MNKDAEIKKLKESLRYYTNKFYSASCYEKAEKHLKKAEKIKIRLRQLTSN